VSTGRASCVGQGLATTQLRLVVASLVKQFRIRFVPGEDGTELLRDMRDQITAQPGRLRLLFEPRE
jgi:cytochrome P450